MSVRRLVVAALLYSALAAAQKREYDFYREFRNEVVPKLGCDNPSITPAQILETYAAKLKSEGLPGTEIARRVRLITTERPQMEADYWNRFFTEGKANYNTAPNAFLM